MKRFFTGCAAVLAAAFLAVPAPSAADPEEDARIQEELEQKFRDSKEIHARFVDRFYWDNSAEVRVEVKDGNVTLRGIVQDSEAKRAFEKIALETAGVKAVDARIRVIPSARKVD